MAGSSLWIGMTIDSMLNDQCSTPGFRAESRSALKIVWFTVSATLAMAVVAPVLLPGPVVDRMVPVCQARARGGQCFLCGATTWFIEIGRGDVAAAQQSNAMAVPLYGAFALNG